PAPPLYDLRSAAGRCAARAVADLRGADHRGTAAPLSAGRGRGEAPGDALRYPRRGGRRLSARRAAPGKARAAGRTGLAGGVRVPTRPRDGGPTGGPLAAADAAGVVPPRLAAAARAGLAAAAGMSLLRSCQTRAQRLR